MVTTATLALSPWAAQALDLADEADIARRLVDLHARAFVTKSRWGWTIRVASWATDEHLEPLHRYAASHLRGPLAQHLHAVISQYARRFAYTPEELATIAVQSGIAIEHNWPVDHAEGE